MLREVFANLLTSFQPPGAEGYRVPRQAEAAEEEQGTMGRIKSSIKSMYDSTVNTAMGYVESIKGLKVEEKAA